MKKIVKIFKLCDPYPDFGYEIACYVKSVLGTFFFLIGILFIFSPFLVKIDFFGILETGLTPTGLQILSFLEKIIFPRGYFGFFLWGIVSLGIGLFFFWRIKLIRKLIKILQ